MGSIEATSKRKKNLQIKDRNRIKNEKSKIVAWTEGGYEG